MTNLKLMRLAARMTQEQFAQRLELTRNEVSKLENGWYAKPPRKRVLMSLQEIFGPNWTFEALMLEAPAPSVPPLPAKRRRSRSKSTQGEKRAAA